MTEVDRGAKCDVFLAAYIFQDSQPTLIVPAVTCIYSLLIVNIIPTCLVSIQSE